MVGANCFDPPPSLAQKDKEVPWGAGMTWDYRTLPECSERYEKNN